MPGLYIVLECDINGLDPYVKGHALATVAEQDSEICLAAGVTPLMSFFSASGSDIADFLESEGLEPTNLPPQELQWFLAAEGLATLAVIEKNFGDNGDVSSEINEWRRVLERARDKDVRWHLAVDF